MSISYGVHLPTHGLYDYKSLVQTAVLADGLGYDYITIGDHLFWVPASAGGDPNRPQKLDAFTVMAALAVNTRRAKIGVRVSPLPFYQPARLAKILTTLDIISEGRLIIGAGAGGGNSSSKDNEFYRSGVGWYKPKERIRRMCESLDILLKLWSDDTITHKGKYYKIDKMPFWPKPVQKPYPPIWFGGSGSGLLKATVKYGTGFFPYPGSSTEDLAKVARRLKWAQAKIGRTKPVLLAPSLIYPDAESSSLSMWSEKISELKDLGASLIMLDFSQEPVSPDIAENFIKEFSVFFDIRKNLK